MVFSDSSMQMIHILITLKAKFEAGNESSDRSDKRYRNDEMKRSRRRKDKETKLRTSIVLESIRLTLTSHRLEKLINGHQRAEGRLLPVYWPVMRYTIPGIGPPPPTHIIAHID
jgi:hypothetical protein